MRFNSKIMPTTDNNCSWHIKAVELVLTNHMSPYHPLVINSLRGGHTHTHTHTYTHSWTEATLRNQAHASLWRVHAWFKNTQELVHIGKEQEIITHYIHISNTLYSVLLDSLNFSTNAYKIHTYAYMYTHTHAPPPHTHTHTCTCTM